MNSRSPNQLIEETSPYLLQHAYNPVNWYPWGSDALNKAKHEDKPIFLSIGYSACHWCHVMERESFENETIAEFLNDYFVSIKVDREEHPDVDAFVMESVQLISGRGGWPLSGFLTPDLRVFFGGTYFPPEDRFNMPGFKRVLLIIRDMWANERNEILKNAEILISKLHEMKPAPPSEAKLNPGALDRSIKSLKDRFDEAYGGFGPAPKFPQPNILSFLLRYGALHRNDGASSMVWQTLDRMKNGGIYDHLGGGFHRYSVDETWLVPHFEKMLYDNALLSQVYTQAYQITGNETYAAVSRSTLDYVLREMVHPHGGFYSAQDADTEGEEGKYYVWQKREIQNILDEDESKLWFNVYDDAEHGNWEGKLILARKPAEKRKELPHRLSSKKVEDRIDEIRQKLLKHRMKRTEPGKDTKILTDWNSLMISSLCLGQKSYGNSLFGDAAKRASEFILENHTEGDTLLHTRRKASHPIGGFLLDYGAFCSCLIDLYETFFDARWLEHARRICKTAVATFYDTETGGFYLSSEEGTMVPIRRKDPWESVLPSGAALMMENLLRLEQLGFTDHPEIVEKTLHLYSGILTRHPGSLPTLLSVLDRFLFPPTSIVIAGKKEWPSTQKAIERIRRMFIPYGSITLSDPTQDTASVPILEGKVPIENRCTIYVCRGKTCQSAAFPDTLDDQDLRSLINPGPDVNVSFSEGSSR